MLFEFFLIIYTEIAKANEQWVPSCSVVFKEKMWRWVQRQDKPRGEAGVRSVLPIPLLPAAKGDTKQLPKISRETVFACSLFRALVGASFQSSPQYFTCLRGVWQTQPVQMCSTTSPSKEGHCQET